MIIGMSATKVAVSRRPGIIQWEETNERSIAIDSQDR
jgi:hypothetical protein